MTGVQNDKDSINDLVRLALSLDHEDEQRWKAVVKLQDLGTAEVFDVARWLSESGNPKERTLGVDILAQGQSPTKTFHEEAVAILLRLLEHEDNLDVLDSVCVALGHRHDPRAIVPLASLKNHPDQDIRYAVVLGLLGYDDALAIQILAELTADESTQVRDWATFGLASLLDADTPELRDALAQRLQDPDPDTRHEAILGLAIRKDTRAIDALLDEVASGSTGPLLLEAAEHLRHDPRTLHVLGRLGETRKSPG